MISTMADDPPKPLARRVNGTLLPGQGRSLNPGGKPKGIEKFVRELIEDQMEDWNGKTYDGWEAMTLMMYDIAMGRRPPGIAEVDIKVKDRMDAVKFLYDRAHGKARIQIDVEQGTTSGLDAINIDDLDVADLNALEDHVEALAAKLKGKAGPGAIIDVDPQADAEVKSLEEAMIGDPDPQDDKEVK